MIPVSVYAGAVSFALGASCDIKAKKLSKWIGRKRRNSMQLKSRTDALISKRETFLGDLKDNCKQTVVITGSTGFLDAGDKEHKS
ncbi:hypothetical protein BDZ88DRAFT_294716 [Geranomyces variabilis]|nr:hypothetical protein BDZ88DRAFT_294716 [Geranomyces variabilis]